MSDSSDASSSDDELLASPVFKKRDRRTDRADKTKLDFLETCIRGSDARTDVQRRIAEVDCELFGITQQLVSSVGRGGGTGGEEDEEDEGGRKEGRGGGDQADDSDGPSKEGVGGGGGGGGREERGKENARNNAPFVAAASVGNGTDRPPTIKTTTTTTATAGVATALKSSEPGRNGKNEEEAYWARIDSFVEENATTRGRGTDAHSARRRLDDAISGLEGYESDVTDDEGGKWRDGMCGGTTRERMRSEAEARSQGSCSRLGLRRTFFRRPPGAAAAAASSIGDLHPMESARGSRVFETRDEATDELRSIVSSLRKSHRDARTKSDIVLRKMFVDPLVRIITRSPKDGTWDCIHNFLLNNAVLAGRFAILLPESFCEWLWKMACSSFDVGKHCPTTCCNLIRKFLVRRMDVRDLEVDGAASFRVDMAFMKKYSMDDLVSCLVSDFGLWLGHGPMPMVEKSGNGSNDNNGGERANRVDVCALKNMFLVWLALFDRNLIMIRETEEDKLFGRDASRVLVAFARVGLDPSFNEADENYGTCGEPLLALIQKLTSSLITTATNQISKRFESGEHVERWMKHTADLMVDACYGLLAGDEDAADSDDARGDLALAMAVKRMSSYSLDTGFSIDVSMMKMMFSERALHICLTEIIGLEDKVKKRCPPAKKDLQHAMHALVTAEVGFLWIDEQSESLMHSHSRFLAAVLIAGECATIGAGVCWRYETDSQSEDEPVKTTKESDAVYEIVSNIEDLCDGLKKECRAVIAYPHLRRTKEYLTRLTKELGALKGKSSKDKGQKRREQGSLDTYFSRPSMSQSDPYRETQNS